MSRAAIVAVGLGFAVAIGGFVLFLSDDTADESAESGQAQAPLSGEAGDRDDQSDEADSSGSEETSDPSGSNRQDDATGDGEALSQQDETPLSCEDLQWRGSSSVMNNEQWSPRDIRWGQGEDLPTPGESEDFVDDLVDCLKPGEPLVIVSGLPKVSGLYVRVEPTRSSADCEALLAYGCRSFDAQLGYGYAGSYEGESLADYLGSESFVDAVGQCFVAPEGVPFRTVTTFYLDVPFGDPGDVEMRYWSIDIDVGMTFDGKAVVGINAYKLADESGRVERLEAAYLSGLTGANVEVDATNVTADTSEERRFPWKGKGYVTFTSTYYDITEYRNVLTPGGSQLDSWRPGDPQHTGVVTIFCG